MADNNQAIEWYLARDGQQHGPVTEAELGKIIELGYLRPTDLVWRQGMAEWAVAEAVLDLSAARKTAVQPQPPVRTAEEPPRPQAPASVAAPHVRLEPEPGATRQQASASRGAAQAPAPAASYPAREPGAPYQQSPATRQHRPGPRDGFAADAHPNAQPQGNGPGMASPHSAQVDGPRPSGPTIGRPEPRRPLRPAELEDEVEEVERRGFPWKTAIVLVLLAGLAAAGFALHRAGKLSNLPFLAAPSVTEGGVPVVSRPNTAARDASAEPATAAVPAGLAQDVDAGLQKSPLWQKLKKEFPDWYRERLAEIGRMSSESKSEREISAAMLRALIELRREHHAAALAASPARLSSIAASFVQNLAQLSRESTAACYGYISQGEVSPMIRPEQRPMLDQQLSVVFEAVAEGRKSPTKREPPKREDYDLLSSELGKRGWSAADLQLFTDARALSRAAPEKVCQMVQDWFAAQLAVEDEGARIRLLGEALKPVVAG